MGGGNLVSGSQAGAMGGANKPAGGTTDNTFQNKDIRQVVMLVRFKPKDTEAAFGDESAATNMIKGATDAVGGVVSTVENAASSIPGLNMVISEKKKDSQSQSVYTYDYSQWDSKLKAYEPNLQAMNPQQLNKVADPFEFSSTDAKGRKDDAKKLADAIKAAISGWSQYTVWLHLIGLGQGGNVINEASILLAGDSTFQSEKNWCVKSIIYVSTALYRDVHVLNQAVFKGQGNAVYFGNNRDLTQHAVDFLEPQDKLLTMIKNANSNTLSLSAGKIELRVVRILTLVLGGLNLSIGHYGDLGKFELIKNEAVGIVSDLVDIVKEIITDTASFVHLDKLPVFGDMVKGYDTIPGKSKAILETFFSNLGQQALQQVKGASLSLGPRDLAGLLNCLCPLFDQITASLAVFDYESKASAGLAAQIIDNSGVTTVYAPLGVSDTDLSKLDADDYKKVTGRTISDAATDPAFLFVGRAQNLVGQAGDTGSDITKFNDDQKIALGEALFFLARSMTLSKEEVYKQLLELKEKYLNFKSLTDKISASKLMSFPEGVLKNWTVDYPQQLKDSIAGTDAQIDRIKGYFDSSKVQNLVADSFYFIFDAHNAMFKAMPEDVAYSLDQATGYVDYQSSKGYTAQFPTTNKNTYALSTSTEKNNVLSAQPLPAAGVTQ